ncbi:pleckstrin homology domain-containing family A member 8 isoform X2 [Pelodiscus sinensis]|uniref:pleckstrin homology domain-containing family A member 8 isoform X2 n=1 Tax=Pelodiscus sinensis TaxID=13735 RepID=UPI003F6B711B
MIGVPLRTQSGTALESSHNGTGCRAPPIGWRGCRRSTLIGCCNLPPSARFWAFHRALARLRAGWQPRWFLLCGGILSYYDSQEDAWKGCKGSIQMAVCEIQVHPTDNTRMDLIIPGEQYFYLKARNAAERQKWLVALGTAKACLTDSRTQREKEFTESTEALKTKMSELRLYCDLLVQQVDKTKEASICDISESENGIDMGALLKSTCNTFLKTLDECMQIANVAFSSELLLHTPSGSPHLAVLKSNKVISPVSSNSTTTERQMELHSCENGSIKTETNHCEQTLINPLIPSSLKSNDGDCDIAAEDDVEKKLIGDEVKDDGDGKMLPIESNSANESLQSAMYSLSGPAPSHLGEEEEDIPTFFSVMSNRFSDIELQENEGIPTEEFLQSCYAIVPVLDKLGPTVFAPVKMDFVGNIKKINQKYITNTEEFNTLQKIVLHEVSAEVAHVRNSATEALLWLKRGLKFLKGFLEEVKNGEKNIQTALIPLSSLHLPSSPVLWRAESHASFPLSGRQCLWQDFTAASRLGCARGFCVSFKGSTNI